MTVPLIVAPDGFDRWRQAIADPAGVAAAFTETLPMCADRDSLFAPIRTPLDTPMGEHRPSDDPRVYVSIASYYWPTPGAPGGLPYVSHDGRFSPRNYDFHIYDFEKCCNRVFWLGRRALLLDDGEALALAEAWLDAWFVDETTSLYPHLNHAQFIPGQRDGWAVGTIDFGTRLPGVIDTVRALGTRLSSRVRQGFDRWADALLDWLIDGPYTPWLVGTDRNNIGTYYDLLV
ncbi:MAG: alginate lyase family protein, partial [Planctomycetota bacterium]